MATSQLDTYIDQYLDHYLDLVVRFCAQPSISAQNQGIREMAGLVKEALEVRGLSVTVFETAGNPVVVGRTTGNSDKTLLFYNHYDVQPPEPLELWTTPPFEPAIRDGCLFARGAADDKGELVARLAAFDAVKAAHGGELPCNVVFLVEGEEEVGSPNLEQFITENMEELTCGGVLWEAGLIDEEGHPWGVLGLRGWLAVELSLRTMSRDAHSGYAHILPSAAWRLIQALATLKDRDERILIPGFYDGVQPVSDADIALMENLPDQDDQLKGQYEVDRFLLGLSGLALKKAVFNPTCNIQGVTTGYTGKGMKTVIPACASAKLDFRLVPGQDPFDLFDKLRRHLDAQGFEDITLERHSSMFPHKDQGDNALVRLSVETGRAVFGKEPRIDPLFGGSGPGYVFSRILGAPITYAGVTHPGARFHAPDEHVRLDNFRAGAKQIARILDGFADAMRRK